MTQIARPDVVGVFDPASHTISYVVSDPATGAAAIIDPVLDFDPAAARTSTGSLEHLLALVADRGLSLQYVLETHAHADHLTGAHEIRERTGAPIGIGEKITRVQKTFGDLGITLSDVYGMDAFLRDYDLYFCKLFDGARHDSGDPFQWGERMLAHYAANRVDPRTKTLIFSDGLTMPRTIELYRQFRGRCVLALGIGTNLTNDLGYEPLQIVIKMIRCNGQPVAKLSDTPSKNMCEDEKYLAYLRQVFQIEQPAA